MVYIASFVGPNCLGNVHEVTSYEHTLPDLPASESLDTIRVELAIKPDVDFAETRFSRAGHWIQHCGSGTLAAAYALLGMAQAPKIKALQTLYETLPIRMHEGLCAYCAQAPGLRTAGVNALAVDALGAVPQSCWQTPDGAYQIWVYSDFGVVKGLTPDFALLKQVAQCSWIVTAPGRDTGAVTSDYVLRYFTPAYGTPEDAATGSANVLLGAYWQYTLRKFYVTGRQLSRHGGCFGVQAAEKTMLESLERANLQWISGEAKWQGSF